MCSNVNTTMITLDFQTSAEQLITWSFSTMGLFRVYYSPEEEICAVPLEYNVWSAGVSGCHNCD